VNEVVAEKVSEKKVVAALEPIDNSDLSDVEKVQEAIELISSLGDYDAHYKANKHLNNLLAEVSPQTEESEEDAVRREAREMGY
jgi:predicted dinucleotide-binding enzyme